MPDEQPLYFALFNEVGILDQLSRSMFEARLPKGVLVSHFAVLNHLIRVANGRTPLELARAFQTPKATMTHTLAALEAAGYVEALPNPEDKRSKRVWLTPAGRAFRDEAVALLAPDLAALEAAFPRARAAALLPLLEDLRRIMDARRD